MRAGELRHRVRVQEKVITRDAIGGEMITWKDRGTVWAEVEPLAGRELFAAQQIQPEATMRFGLRYWSEIKSEWQVIWQEQTFDVLSVIDVGARRRKLQLLARTGVKGG